jgi:formylglycine-generating enzyme required for sulfatase activity
MIEAFQRLKGPPAESGGAREEQGYAPVTDGAVPGLDASTEPHVPMATEPARPASPHLLPVARTPRRSWVLALVGAGACALVASVGFRARSHAAARADCPDGMARVPGAAFHMGSPPTADTPSDETTASGAPNLVAVQTFCLDTTEVTALAYSKCAACERPTGTVDFEGLTPNGRAFESQFCNPASKADHPINCVDWQQAKDYCSRVGKRLPTEAEWELSARGQELRTYAWGEEAPSASRLNACGAECSRMLTVRLEKIGKGAGPANPLPAMYPDDDTAEATAPVGHYPGGATPEGVLDLAGNVWEWTASPYCPYPYDEAAACGDSRRVLRGGGWDTTGSQDVRAARRYPSAPSARGKSIGFRCAKSL